MSGPHRFDGRPARRGDVLRQAGRVGFLLAWTGVTTLALLPGTATPPRFLGTDKTEHLIAFTVLAALMRFGWPRLRVWLIVLVLAAHGGLIELIQRSVPLDRTGSLMDFVADLVGISLGLLVAEVMLRASRRGTRPAT